MDRRFFLGGLSGLLAAPLISGAQEPARVEREPAGEAGEANARQRFFEPHRSGRDFWAGIRINLVLRRDNPNGSGTSIHEVSSREVFRSGDRIRFRVQPNTDGYVYVLSENDGGSATLMFPLTADGPKANKLKAFEIAMAPRTDWLRFDNEPGVEPFRIFFSPKPIDTFEALRKKKDATVGAHELLRLAASLVPDEMDRIEEESHGGSVPAIYSIARLDSDSDALMDRFELTHRPARRVAR